MVKRVCCGAALALSALGASVAGAEEVAIERSFNLAPGGVLTVVAERASVDVRGGSEGVGVAISRRDDDAAAIEADFDIAFEQTDAGLRLSVLPKDGLLPKFGWNKAVRIAVRTPRDFGVDVATSGGSVGVVGVSGAVVAATRGGSLRFEDVPGAVTGSTSGGSIRHTGRSASVVLETSGGSIGVGEVDGDVSAQTSGGRINVAKAGGAVAAKTSGGSIRIDAAGGAVQAKTSGGSVDVAFTAQPEAASRVVTTGGTITVALAPSVAVDVEASTSGGSVRLREGLRVEGEVAKRRLAGTINGGGPGLVLRTSGGAISLRPL